MLKNTDMESIFLTSQEIGAIIKGRHAGKAFYLVVMDDDNAQSFIQGDVNIDPAAIVANAFEHMCADAEQLENGNFVLRRFAPEN